MTMSQQYRPSDTAYFDFTVTSSLGALISADSLPTAKILKNGAIDAAVAVTVNAALQAGVYSGTYVIPSGYAAGDDVRVLVQATVGGQAGGGVVDKYRLVAWPPTALPNAAAASAGGVITSGTGTGQLSVTAGGGNLNLAQAVPNSASASPQTVGDALLAARAQGFGKWALSGTTLSLYASDGTTVVRTFTLDSASAPTTRA